MSEKTFYDLKARSITGEEIQMSDFKGKTVMVVNTASKCGLTPQYEGLEKIYQKYRDQGLVILGFPSNQFGQQEPGDEGQIQEFCEANYGVSFPMFSKVDVNGSNTHEVFNFLRSNLSGLLGSRIKWNFTKFVVDKNGQPKKRFAPTTKPESMESYLQKIL